MNDSRYFMSKCVICTIYSIAFLSSCSEIKMSETSTAIQIQGENIRDSPTLTTHNQQVLSSATFSPAPSIIPSITPTFRSTIEPSQVAATFLGSISSVDDNLFPQLFGITPGQTTIDHAMEIFDGFGFPLQSNRTSDDGNIFNTQMIYPDSNITMAINITEENELFKNVDIGINLTHIEDNSYPEIWNAYNPGTIIEKFGTPSKMGLNLSFPTESIGTNIVYYDMVMIYDQWDFSIEYFHGQTTEGDLITACPKSDPFSSVSINYGKGKEFKPYLGSSIDDVTSISIDQFTEILRQDLNKSCIELSKEAFFPED